jgi:hypothetical protein
MRAALLPPRMTGEDLTMIRPRSVYPNNRGAYELVIFDVRIPHVAERLHHERAAWQERGDIEALDEGHFVLIVRASVVRGWTA